MEQLLAKKEEPEHTEGGVESWKLGFKKKVKCYYYIRNSNKMPQMDQWIE